MRVGCGCGDNNCARVFSSTALRLISPDQRLRSAPERCLWGTDWPHIYLEGRPMPNTTDLFECTYNWLSASQALSVFVDNPARLYGLASATVPNGCLKEDRRLA